MSFDTGPVSADLVVRIVVADDDVALDVSLVVPSFVYQVLWKGLIVG